MQAPPSSTDANKGPSLDQEMQAPSGEAAVYTVLVLPFCTSVLAVMHLLLYPSAL